MSDVSVSEFRERLQHWLKRVQRGERIRLTMRGETIAEVVPAVDAKTAARIALAQLRKTAIVGDVTTPISATWTVDRDRL